MVGTVPQKKEEVIGRNSPTKNSERLLVETVPQKSSEEVIGRNSPTKKIVKGLLVGTVPPKNSEGVIRRNSPTKKERGYW